jgi:hypothetical protein
MSKLTGLFTNWASSVREVVNPSLSFSHLMLIRSWQDQGATRSSRSDSINTFV